MKFRFGMYILAVCIPVLLVYDAYQSRQYAELEKEVKTVQKMQYELVENNKRLLSGISVLSTPERIEKIAIETLGMRKAFPAEIVRIELKGNKNGS